MDTNSRPDSQGQFPQPTTRFSWLPSGAFLLAVSCLSQLGWADNAPPASETNPQNNSNQETPAAEPTDLSKPAAGEEHFKLGRDAIQAKNWETAISELELALKENPKSGPYHHALGVAYMGDKQANAGWFHFRQAVRLAPSHAPSIIDFMKTWKLLDAQGVFNVGTPLQKVAETLGKPDQADDQGDRLRLVYGFMSLNFINQKLFSILDMRNLPPEGLHAVDGLAFSVPQPEWKVAYRILSATQGNTEFVRQAESLQRWTELFASQRFINVASKQSAKQMMTGIRARLEEAFGDLEFEILTETDNDTLFVWSIPKTDMHPAQIEVVRLVQGQRDIHRLAYTRKGENLDRKSLTPWIARLKQAKLLPAEKLREQISQEEVRVEEMELKEVSLQILKKQFELIRNENVIELQPYFLKELRDQITKELLKSVSARVEKLDPAVLVDRVEIEITPEGKQARLLTQKGEIFTTLVNQQGRWYASEIWFEALLP